MPATAGRVRMPANNRVHSSAALQTHGIWQSAIGYDPYAPKGDDGAAPSVPVIEEEEENAYASFQGLLALARLSSSGTGAEVRGACKKCNRVGHLTYQCRNFLTLPKNADNNPPDILNDTTAAAIRPARKSSSTESSETDETSDDSDFDSEIERIIARRAAGKSTTILSPSKRSRDESDRGGRRNTNNKKKMIEESRDRDRRHHHVKSTEDGHRSRHRRSSHRRRRHS